MHDFLIGAWVAPVPGDDKHKGFINETQYRRIKEAGLNAIYGLYETVGGNRDHVIKALDMAQKAGIRYLARDRHVLDCDGVSELHERLDDLMTHPAALGVLAVDEPGHESFEKIRAARDRFKAAYPDKMFYVNLLPMYATDAQIRHGAFRLDGHPVSMEAYRDYLRRYVDIVGPDVVSYDFYPFEGPFPGVREDYFTQLDLMSRLDKPIWCFIQTVKFNEKTRVPTLEDIRFQVNTSLAYGHTGIQYFTYFMPLPGERESFSGAMIDRRGRKTDVYGYVKTVNDENHDLYAFLPTLTWEGVWATAKTMKKWNIPSVKPWDELPTKQTDDVLVARFAGDDGTYDMIVNLRTDSKQQIPLIDGGSLVLRPGGVVMMKNKERFL
jgi:hypothetical protein